MSSKLTAEHLRRRAIVYVRQSTMGQVIHHQESQRRQYALVERARELGFTDVVVIDDDLGRSGSGLVDRPGFQRLVAEVCTGEVSAVFCIEASRLARNGRDWHHLIELCAMVGAVVLDPDGIYDPGLMNDRLLLGLKGTMSEFELNLFRQRSREAIRQKAGRGELQFRLPVGMCWNRAGEIELDPDGRVQQALQLVFTKMMELGSVRQVWLWCRREQVSLPAVVRHRDEADVLWRVPLYSSIRYILTNPFYAGAYAFGRTAIRRRVIDGRARKTEGHRQAQSEWTVLIRDHHPGYISWERFEYNQAMISANAHMKSRMTPKAGRGGRALLSGLLRCRRCGSMLKVAYTGADATVLRYGCKSERSHHDGASRCISFGGQRADQLVAEEILRVIQGNAVEAALQAAEQMRQQRQQQRKTVELAVEQARYEEHLAGRRYDAVDPEQRLVAAELERRWNASLEKVRELEAKVQQFDVNVQTAPLPDRELLMSLAQDLPAVWNSPRCEMRLKQRIVRILVREIVADVDDESREVILLLHWAGGRHSEVRWRKTNPGRHGRSTSLQAIEVIRRMAGQFTDEQIATTLNWHGLRTGTGHTWNEQRVNYTRQNHKLPAANVSQANRHLTLDQAAQRLGVSAPTVRRMIENKQLPARQVVSFAPWQIPLEAVESDEVRQFVSQIKKRGRVKGQSRARRTLGNDRQQSMFSESY